MVYKKNSAHLDEILGLLKKLSRIMLLKKLLIKINDLSILVIRQEVSKSSKAHGLVTQKGLCSNEIVYQMGW